MKTLPKTKMRCAGRYTFENDFCPRRYQCARFMAFIEWDVLVGILHYRGIGVTMGMKNCDTFIDIETVKGE